MRANVPIACARWRASKPRNRPSGARRGLRKTPPARRCFFDCPGSALPAGPKRTVEWFNLEIAVGCARVCRERCVRQGRARTQGVLRTACAWRAGGRLCPPRPARPTTQRATARTAEQRCMARRARCNRAHSAVTERVKTLEAVKLKAHAAFRTGASGQLRFLG